MYELNESGIDLIPPLTPKRDKKQFRIPPGVTPAATGTGMEYENQAVREDDALKELSKLKGLYPDEGSRRSGQACFPLRRRYHCANGSESGYTFPTPYREQAVKSEAPIVFIIGPEGVGKPTLFLLP